MNECWFQRWRSILTGFSHVKTVGAGRCARPEKVLNGVGLGGGMGRRVHFTKGRTRRSALQSSFNAGRPNVREKCGLKDRSP